MRTRSAALVLAVALVAGACGGDDETVAPTTTSAPTTTTREPEPVPGRAVVEVLDAGQEPRQALRLAVEPGTQQAVVLVQEQHQEVVIGTQSQATDTTTEQPVTYRVDAVSDGRIETTTVYGRGRLIDAPGDGSGAIVEEVLAAFDGAEGRATFNDRAEVLELVPPRVEVPSLQPVLDALLTGIASQASQLSMPFPEEPVGVGARWRVRTTAEISGLALTLRSDLTVTAITDESVTAEVHQTLTFVPGPVELSGARGEMLGGELTGGGTVEWHLDAPVALVEQSMEGSSTIRVEAGGRSQTIEQHQRQRYQLRQA